MNPVNCEKSRVCNNRTRIRTPAAVSCKQMSRNAFSLVLMSFTLTAADSTPQPPVAKIVPKAVELHGDTRVDNYFWLRDRNDPDTIKYLEAENEYTKSMMKHTDGLQSTLYSEMLGRIQ